MKKNLNIDWFEQLKFDLINLLLVFKSIKEETIFIHLKEMIDTSNNDLDDFIKRINLLEDKSIMFDKTDLKDEFDFIKENIHLEDSFIANMINYIIIINNFTINGIDITEKLEQFQDIDISCYNQMKINNENLKQLKKERRDLF